jgi:spore coat polysaccharide biosynthesis protein SpsF (cytidylyltransferase family)
MQIEGKPMLQLELEHVKKADAVVLATTDLLADLEI